MKLVTFFQPTSYESYTEIHTTAPDIIMNASEYLSNTGQGFELDVTDWIEEQPCVAVFKASEDEEIKVGLLLQKYLLEVLKLQLFSVTSVSDSYARDVILIYTLVVNE